MFFTTYKRLQLQIDLQEEDIDNLRKRSVQHMRDRFELENRLEKLEKRIKQLEAPIDHKE
jgi:septal ring factor EnvC (AmiA/AmiB activator)